MSQKCFGVRIPVKLVSLIRRPRWPYVIEGLFSSVFFFLIGLPWFGAVFPVGWLFEVAVCVVKVVVLFRSCVSSCRPRFCQCKDDFWCQFSLVCLSGGDHIFFLVRSDRGASGSSVWFSKRCSPGTEELFPPHCLWTAIWSCWVGLSACGDPLSLGLFHWQFRPRQQRGIADVLPEGLRSASVLKKQSAVENEWHTVVIKFSRFIAYILCCCLFVCLKVCESTHLPYLLSSSPPFGFVLFHFLFVFCCCCPFNND